METTTLPAMLTPEDVEHLLARGADVRIIDVRTPGEFDSAHIPGSYNVPLDTLGEHSSELSRHLEQPVVLVCRTGVRARRAESALAETGMTNIHLLDGGMVAWETSGGEIRQGAERWEIERQVRLVAGTLVCLGGLGALLGISILIWIPILLGGGLAGAAITDSCIMGRLLMKLPYNQTRTCDITEIVGQLTAARSARS